MRQPPVTEKAEWPFEGWDCPGEFKGDEYGECRDGQLWTRPTNRSLHPFGWVYMRTCGRCEGKGVLGGDER